MSHVFNLRLVSYLFVFCTICLLINSDETIYMEKNITEFDGSNYNDSSITISCPVVNAVWILPATYADKDLSHHNVESRFLKASTELAISLSKVGRYFGTYSCCRPELLPTYLLNRTIIKRDYTSCIHGCCASFLKGCKQDMYENECRQLRLHFPNIKRGSRSDIGWLSITAIKNSPVLLPCMSLHDNVKIKNSNSQESPHIKATFVNGFGYCVRGLTTMDHILDCIYRDGDKRMEVKSFIHIVGNTDKVVEPKLMLWKESDSGTKSRKKISQPALPATMNVLKNDVMSIKCIGNAVHGPPIGYCLKWKDFTCQKCFGDQSDHSRIVWKQRMRKNQQLTCIAQATNGSRTAATSVFLNVSDKPFIHVMLDDESKVEVIQHKTLPVIKVEVRISPQTSNLTLTAIRDDTSTEVRGSCGEWNTMCNVTLQRPATYARYKLEFQVTGPHENVTVTRWVRLISRYNKPPNLTGIPTVGLVGKKYTAFCRQNASPKGKVSWLFADHNKISKKVAKVAELTNWVEPRIPSDEMTLKNTSQRYTCLLCRVTSKVGVTYSKRHCMTRTDVDMDGYDVKLSVQSRNPFYDLGKKNKNSEINAEFVLGAELIIKCMTYHTLSTKTRSIQLMWTRGCCAEEVVQDVYSEWTGYSHRFRTNLIISNFSMNGTKLWCKAPTDWKTSPPIRLLIRQHESPEIVDLPTHRRVLDSHELHQECRAIGVPVPFVYWRHNSKQVSERAKGKSLLRLVNMTRSNSGAYTCVAEGLNRRFVLATLHIDVNPEVYDSKVLIIVMLVVLVLLLVCFLSIAYLFMKNRRLRRKLFDRYRLFLRNGDGENNYTNQFDLSQWQLPTQDLRLAREKLGQGEFGRVLKGLLRRTGAHGGEFHPVAVKQLLSDNLIMGVGRSTEEESGSRRKFMEEIQIMSQVGIHDNVLQMLGVVINEDTLQISLVCEFCEGGNLVHFLQSHQTTFSMRPLSVDEDQCLTYEDLLRIATDVARGMSHIHSQGVLHRDLAARNVLIGANKTAKISDFGLSRNRSDYAGLEYARRNTSEKLPWKWLALECLRDGMFSAKSDVWSYGITLWEVFSLGNKPYPEQYYTNYFIRNLNSGYRLSRPPFASDSVFEVMKSCWLTEPDLRPSFSQITSTFQSLVERWRAEGERTNGSYIGKKQGLSNGDTHDKPTMHVQYVNVVGSLPSEHAEDCEMKLMEAYVPMSEGSAYTTYSHVF